MSLSTVCYDCKAEESDYVQIGSCPDEEIRCNVCREKRWPRKDKVKQPSKMVNYMQLLREDSDTEEDLTKNISLIKKSLSFICETMDYFQKQDIKNQEKFKVLSSDVAGLKKQMTVKDEEVQSLSSRLEDLEQRDKINNIIVSGIELKTFGMAVENTASTAQVHPSQRNGNGKEEEKEPSPSNRDIMIEKFAVFAKDKLDVVIVKSDIQQIIPLKSKDGSSKTTKIVFATNEKKREVFTAKKKLFHSNVKNVYINEDLTPKNFKLLMEARRMKRESGNIEGVWTFDCTVFIKTLGTVRQRGKIMAIRKQEDFTKINN